MYQVVNFLNNERGYLEPLHGDLVEQDLQKIVEICNCNEVYDFLFREKFIDKKYSLDDAKRFVTWATKGWQEGRYFVFLLRNQKGIIVGAIDLKSNQDPVEVGYWADPNERGWMSNSLLELVKIAKSKNINRLFANIKSKNLKSKKVLANAGYLKVKDFWKNDISYERYELNSMGHN